jgi:hypothetical protein
MVETISYVMRRIKILGGLATPDLEWRMGVEVGGPGNGDDKREDYEMKKDICLVCRVC